MFEIDLFEHRLKTTARGVHLFMLAGEVRADPAIRYWRDPSGNGNSRTAGDEMRDLRRDLARLEDGWWPDEEDLADVPILKDWGITFCEGERLWRLMGDPYHAARELPGVVDGQTLCTMQVLAIDDEFAWARDRRGFYRLGQPRA